MESGRSSQHGAFHAVTLLHESRHQRCGRDGLGLHVQNQVTKPALKETALLTWSLAFPSPHLSCHRLTTHTW